MVALRDSSYAPAIMQRNPTTLRSIPIAVAMCMALAVPAVAADPTENPACGKKVAAQGAPSPIQSIASLNAVQLWIELAEEQQGADSAMWHNADGGLIKCELVKRSEMFRCYATGKPCLPSVTPVSAVKPN